MKKISFLIGIFFLLSGCCLLLPWERFGFSYSAYPEDFTITPDKQVYKVNEEIGIDFFIPINRGIGKNLKEEIENPPKVLQGKLYQFEQKEVAYYIINGKEMEEDIGKITFVYDQLKEEYHLQDDLKLVFRKAGSYDYFFDMQDLKIDNYNSLQAHFFKKFEIEE